MPEEGVSELQGLLRGHKDKLFISPLREFQASSGNRDDSHELKRQARQKRESELKGGDSDTTCHMNSEKEGPMRD